MQNITFPIQFTFKISSFANDFTVTSGSGTTIAYVRQKMFKLKESIQVYDNELKGKVNYEIKADRWLDFNAAYALIDQDGNTFGKVVRKGWKSIWKAKYLVIDENNNEQYNIQEENAWVKVFDSLLGEIPILNFFTGYFFNPAYLITNQSGEPMLRLKKLPSFWGRKFELNRIGELDADDDDRVMLAVMMMLLLERRRG